MDFYLVNHNVILEGCIGYCVELYRMGASPIFLGIYYGYDILWWKN